MFKFSKFDKYSFGNLEKNQLWCNHYDAFNDPFECWCIEKTGIPDPEIEKDRYESIVSAWGYDCGHEHKQELFEYCSQFDNEYSMRVAHYTESARLSCFCKRSDNLLMWSHYADGLRGFCIEFDKKKLLKQNENNSGIYKVLYRKTPPVVDTMLYEVANDQVWYHEMAIEEDERGNKYLARYVPDNLLPEYHKALIAAKKLLFELYFKMLCYKPLDWKYEDEVRLIYHTKAQNKQGEAFHYPITAIKSIVIGEKATKENIQHLRSILGEMDLNIPLSIARRNRNNYKVNIEPL